MRLKHIILVFLFLPLINQAQNAFVNKGSAVYIQQKALMEISGNLVNDSGSSSISNDGTIEISGNFINSPGATFGVYNNNSSTDRVVKFMGSGTQTISGNMSTAGHSSFYNLVIDKATAADSVEMLTGVVVEGSLVFGTANTTTTYNPSSLYTNNNQKGLFKTYDSAQNEYLLDIQNGNADAVAGYPVLEMGQGQSTGYVLTSGIRGSSNGGLQRKISSATSYIFPVGTSDKGFNGALLNFSRVPGGGSVKTKFCDGSSSPDGYVGILSQYCSGCDANTPSGYTGYNRYFESNPCNNGVPQWIIFANTAQNHGYWSFASTNTGYQYDMEVFPNSYSSDIDIHLSTMRVLKHEAAYGDDPSVVSTDWTPEVESLISNINDLTTYTKNAGCYTGNGVPGGTYTDFSQFTMAMNNSGGALPVTLLYIKATPAGKHHIDVTWATALEINNAGFEVMRSTDGVNFSDLGWVAGHDNSTVTESYLFDDKVAQENVAYYYKLKQVDNNGKFVYTNIAEAMLTQDQSAFALYPNPTANDLFLTLGSAGEEIKVIMYDMTGRAVYDNIFTVEGGGSQTVTINAASMLPPGTYLVDATSNGSHYTGKVVLQ